MTRRSGVRVNNFEYRYTCGLDCFIEKLDSVERIQKVVAKGYKYTEYEVM